MRRSRGFAAHWANVRTVNLIVKCSRLGSGVSGLPMRSQTPDHALSRCPAGRPIAILGAIHVRENRLGISSKAQPQRELLIRDSPMTPL